MSAWTVFFCSFLHLSVYMILIATYVPCTLMSLHGLIVYYKVSLLQCVCVFYSCEGYLSTVW